MDEDLVKSLFLRARDQYETAIRWALVVGLVCLAFFFVTFRQFIRVNKDLAIVQADIDQLSAILGEVQGLGESLEDLNASVTVPLKQVSASVPDLIERLQALNSSVQTLRDPQVPVRHSPESGIMVQRLVQSREVQQDFQFPEELAGQIVNAKSVIDIRKVLRPFIERNIVDPVFQQLNDHWQKDIVPSIEGKSQVILAKLTRGEKGFTDSKDLWGTIRQSVAITVQVANELEFHPPEDPFWWSSVRGKQVALFAIESEASARLQSAMVDSDVLAELNTQLKASLAREEELQDSLKQNLERVKKDFETYRRQLVALGKPFEFLTVDLNVFVSFFPLFLGVVLAAISIWPARRLQELAESVELMAKRGHGEPGWSWFFGRTRFAFPSRGGTPVKDRLAWKRWQEWFPWILGPFCSAWVGIAVWELARWGEVSHSTLIISGVAACLAVAFAQVYRLYVIRHVLEMSETIANAETTTRADRNSATKD